MKKFVLDKCMNIIRSNKDYDDVKLAEIKYGLEAIYLTVTKTILIGFLAILLGIFKEFIIFMLIFTVMRSPSFGIHASKTWMCIVSSTLSFIGIPLIALYLKIDVTSKVIIGFISVVLISLFSPADTHKKPIVNKKRRKIYKILSFVVASVYVVLSITIKDNFLSNSFLMSTLLQNILISPITYRIFKMPYNNYKAYIAKYGLN